MAEEVCIVGEAWGSGLAIVLGPRSLCALNAVRKPTINTFCTCRYFGYAQNHVHYVSIFAIVVLADPPLASKLETLHQISIVGLGHAMHV